MPGPLTGIKVLEIPNIGPLQHAGMILSDLGAEVLRLDRKTHVETGGGLQGPYTARSILDRGRRSAGIDLKAPGAAGLVLSLAEQADVMVEGFRPGVSERLGIGPDAALARNPRLVYGRMTGWGQDGPMARDVGHDINYISLGGALAHIGSFGGPPVPPLNLVGDFGGGSMLLVVGLLAALVERGTSGQGQVVDAAMVDGTALLMAAFFSAGQGGNWGPRGTNVLDGGAPWYGVYQCADGEYVSLAAIEPQFFAQLCRLVPNDAIRPDQQWDRAGWPAMQATLEAWFRTRTRDEWCTFMDGHEVCFAPVLTMNEARAHPHNVARRAFVEVEGVEQPAPAPRFSRTVSATPSVARRAGADTDTALADWGIPADEIAALRAQGTLA